MSPRYGLRVGPDYPHERYRGDVITFGNSTREQVEDIRDAMTTGRFHEVVELDHDGQVIAYGLCTGCGAVEVALVKATGMRDLSGIGESATYPTGYGCEVCS